MIKLVLLLTIVLVNCGDESTPPPNHYGNCQQRLEQMVIDLHGIENLTYNTKLKIEKFCLDVNS